MVKESIGNIRNLVKDYLKWVSDKQQILETEIYFVSDSDSFT